MDGDLFGFEVQPSDNDDGKSRRVEERMKERWLWIIGIAGFLLPGVCPPFTFFWTSQEGMYVLHLLNSSWPYPHLFTPGMTMDYWIKALSMYIVLAVGATLSAVWLWHRIVHKAKKPGWKKGMKAGILANLLAYPFTGLVLLWFNLLVNFPNNPGIENLLSLFFSVVAATVLGPLFGIVGLLFYGWWTTPVALLLGALCGWLEGWNLRRSRREILKYS